jgi:SAM-dependent methyltransferase
MGKLLNIVSSLHKKTQRDYIGRMRDNKVECMEIAKRYDKDYWDGDRRHGYGGFKYDGRWEIVARKLIEEYNLSSDAKILDVGCGKGFLLHELKKLLPQAVVKGFDISRYALDNAKEEIKDNLFLGEAELTYNFGDKEFDLVISINTLHNLFVSGVKMALREMERVSKNKYLVVEGYRNPRELFNLQCWVLTGECFFAPKEWEWMFNEFGYTGDYEFIYFE